MYCTVAYYPQLCMYPPATHGRAPRIFLSTALNLRHNWRLSDITTMSNSTTGILHLFRFERERWKVSKEVPTKHLSPVNASLLRARANDAESAVKGRDRQFNGFVDVDRKTFSVQFSATNIIYRPTRTRLPFMSRQ